MAKVAWGVYLTRSFGLFFRFQVVFHELMHGVTNRLVGGPMNDHALEAVQSGGTGEGWGDYIAGRINNSTVVGDSVLDDPAGIRGFPDEMALLRQVGVEPPSKLA